MREKLRESTTLKIVLPAAILLITKFALAGFYGVPEMSATEFGMSLGAVMAIWLGREYTEKVSKHKHD